MRNRMDVSVGLLRIIGLCSLSATVSLASFPWQELAAAAAASELDASLATDKPAVQSTLVIVPQQAAEAQTTSSSPLSSSTVKLNLTDASTSDTIPASASSSSSFPTSPASKTPVPIAAINNQSGASETPSVSSSFVETVTPTWQSPDHPPANATDAVTLTRLIRQTDSENIGTSGASAGAGRTSPPADQRFQSQTRPATVSPKEPLSSVKLRTLQEPALPPNDNVKLVLVIAGNANKNPDELLRDSVLPASLPPGMLSTIGRQQAYNFGSFLRRRYGSMRRIVFNASEVQGISGSSFVAQTTLQTMLASFYLPNRDNEIVPKLKWQPTPISFDDYLLDASKVKCPALDEANLAVEKLIERSFGEKKKIISYIAEKAGWDSRPSTLAKIGSNLEQIALRNLSVPSWITTNPFDANLYGTVLHLRFLYQLACARNSDCRRLLSGSVHNLYYAVREFCGGGKSQDCHKTLDTLSAMYLQTNPNRTLRGLLHQLAMDFKAKKENNLPNTAKIYSTSNDVLATLLWSLGIETAGVPSGRVLLLEFQDSPQPAVRTLFTEFVDQRPDSMLTSVIRLPLCGAVGGAGGGQEFSNGEWCPFRNFMKAIENETTADVKQACRATETSCDNKKLDAGDQLLQKDVGFNRVSILVDCNVEEDRSGNYYCQQWAKYDYCKDYLSVRDYYCRYTCLCDDKFKVTKTKSK